MFAIRVHHFGGPEVLRLEEVPEPVPGPRQVLVRLRAVGVNPVETYIRSGAYARLPDLPYTPGTDGAGVVEAMGLEVHRFRIGDRVYVHGTTTGSYAALAVADEADVRPLPAQVSFAQGAALGIPYATAHRALFARAQVQSGETVLVHGASGGVGLAAVQWAATAGCRVIGTAGTEAGRQRVAEQGAVAVLDHSAPGYLDTVNELTQGRGVDVVLEMLANVNLGRDLTVLARKGRVVVIGSRGTVEVQPRELMRREADVRGMILANATSAELAEIHTDIGRALVDGRIRPVIAHEWSLAQAAEAHRQVLEAGHVGKVILVPG